MGYSYVTSSLFVPRRNWGRGYCRPVTCTNQIVSWYRAREVAGKHTQSRSQSDQLRSVRVPIRSKMDVGDRVQAGQAVVKDVLGERAQKMFQDFLEE